MLIPINLTVTVVFGVPGSGKTTLAAKIARQEIDKRFAGKDAYNVFANFPLDGAILFDPLTDLGVYDIRDSVILIDEAGIDFNNRKFKSFPASLLKWCKLHRHYTCSVFVFSQSYDDMDITFRRLATSFWLCRKIPLVNLLVVRPIKRRIGIDETTHQITDMFFWDNKGIKIVNMRKYWQYFDSFEAPPLAPRKWKAYHKKNKNTP